MTKHIVKLTPILQSIYLIIDAKDRDEAIKKAVKIRMEFVETLIGWGYDHMSSQVNWDCFTVSERRKK